MRNTLSLCSLLNTKTLQYACLILQAKPNTTCCSRRLYSYPVIPSLARDLIWIFTIYFYFSSFLNEQIYSLKWTVLGFSLSLSPLSLSHSTSLSVYTMQSGFIGRGRSRKVSTKSLPTGAQSAFSFLTAPRSSTTDFLHFPQPLLHRRRLVWLPPLFLFFFSLSPFDVRPRPLLDFGWSIARWAPLRARLQKRGGKSANPSRSRLRFLTSLTHWTGTRP